MATKTPEQVAQESLALRNANPTMSRRDAIVQVRGGTPPVAPPPVVSPPVAPVAPVPTTPPQTMQGVDGQTFQVAPTDPQTGLSQSNPVAPAPIAPVNPPPVEPVAPKVEIPVAPVKTTPEANKTTNSPNIDYNTSVGRENDISSNVQNITATNPALLKDRNAFNNAFGYETADTGKKALLDASFAQGNTPQVLNEGDVLAQMIAGVKIPPQNTQAFRNAEYKYKSYQKFASMTPSQLVDNMKMSEIGTEMSQLLSQNPNYIKAKQDYDKFRQTATTNAMMSSVYGGIKGTNKDTNTSQVVNDTIAKKFDITDANHQAYVDLVKNDPKSLELANTVSSVTKQLNRLNTERNAVYKDLKSQYPTLSASAISTLMNTRTQVSTDQINALNSTLELTTADLKMAMDMAKGEYEASSKDITAKQEIAKEDRTFNNALKLDQAKFDQDIKQKAESLNTPELAIPDMIEEYKKLGIPLQRSTQQIINDFKASGKDLPTFLSELQKTIQSKPEYKRVLEIKAGALSDSEKLKYQTSVENARDTRNFSQQKELAFLNKDLSRQEFLWQLENDPEKKAKAYELEQKINANKSLFDIMGKNVGTYSGNRGYDLAGKLGDPLPAGGNWTVKSIGVATSALGVPYKPGYKAPYGNTVVMTDENGNEVRYSHLETIGVKAGDILGFGSIVGTRGNTGNVKGANGETLTGAQLLAGRGAHLDVEIKDSKGRLLSNAQQVDYLKSKKAGSSGGLTDTSFMTYNSPTFKPQTDLKTAGDKANYEKFLSDKKNVMGDKNAGIEDILRYSAGGKDLTDTSIKSLEKFDSALAQLGGIQEQISKMDTGPILGRLKNINPYDTDAQVLKAQLTSLIPNLARGVYGEVGVLTDNDVRLYSQTIPNLTSTQDVNNAILAMTLKVVAGGYKRQLQSLAAAGKDVSGFSGLYDNLMGNVAALEGGLNIKNTPSSGTNNFTASNGNSYNLPTR